MTPACLTSHHPAPSHPPGLWPCLCLLSAAAAAPSAHARVTCQILNASQPTNPFTVSATLHPFGDTVYARPTLSVTCQRDDARASVDIEIGATNTKRGTRPRVAILSTNADWGIGYALTYGEACASNTAASNWFDLGYGMTYKNTLTFSGSSASISVPACLAVGHSNNVAYRAGTYQDNISFTLAYREWLELPEVYTSINMVYSVNVLGGCRISQDPGDLALAYPAFSATDLSASTTLGLTCNPDLPWSAALNPDRGRAGSMHLDYRLSLSASQGAGIGYQQNLAITATAARGQGGVCASSQCTERTTNKPYTVTISY